MTDTRDIDEILASLDALLREGDSHNDDIPAKPVEPTPDHDVAKVDLESDIEFVEASAEAFLASDELEDESFTVEAVSDEVVTWQEGGMSRVVLTEDMMVENPQVSLPLAFNSEALNEDDVQESESPALEEPKSDHTTQDVEQQDEQLAADAIADDVAPSHVTHLHKQDIEQLLTLVTEDVSSHLQQMLPKLIRESLHTHLSRMQDEPNTQQKTSDDE
ncbi:MAG: hypothetical protein JKY80_06655 [Mariprofundaceae bacterium]|nr:hypothetical protein [Mariprofundaceae bacterium]